MVTGNAADENWDRFLRDNAGKLALTKNAGKTTPKDAFTECIQ